MCGCWALPLVSLWPWLRGHYSHDCSLSSESAPYTTLTFLSFPDRLHKLWSTPGPSQEQQEVLLLILLKQTSSTSLKRPTATVR